MSEPIRSLWCRTLYSPEQRKHNVGLILREGKIAEVVETKDATGFGLAFQDGLVAPGLIDIQVNGALGHSFQAADEAFFGAIIDFHLNAGTTTLLPTLITAPVEMLVHSLAVLAQHLDKHSPATLPSIHLEGPFLSAGKRGAHDANALLMPDAVLMQRLCKVANDHIGMVTLAPELPGSTDVIRQLAARGIVVAAGHSEATFADMRAAVDAGLSMVTHAGNASDWPHRALNPELGFMASEPGVVGSFLALSQLRGSLILDGFHVHPALLGIHLKVKGVDGLILTSDASTVAGSPPGDYDSGGISAKVDARGFAVSRRGGNGLAGSVIPLLTAVQRAIQLAGVDVAAALTMATRTPARLMGLEAHKGVIKPNADADLLVLNDDLSLRHVIASGVMVK